VEEMLFNKASRFKRGKKVDEQTEVISLPSLDAKSIVSLKRDSEISGRQGVVNVGGQSADPSFFNFNSIFDDEQVWWALFIFGVFQATAHVTNLHTFLYSILFFI
jgi:hypothetical protein